MGHNRAASGRLGNRESRQSNSNRIMEIFNIGTRYISNSRANRILKENDLSIAISQCTELKALINTILSVSGECHSMINDRDRNENMIFMHIQYGLSTYKFPIMISNALMAARLDKNIGRIEQKIILK
jgi:hypothetical protein